MIFFFSFLNANFAPPGLSVVDSRFILNSEQVIKNNPVYLLCLKFSIWRKACQQICFKWTKLQWLLFKDFQFCCNRVTWFFLCFWRRLDLCFSRRGILGKGWSLSLCVCVCVCVLGGGSLPREHNKLFVFIMHLAFEKRMKVSLFYFTLSSTVFRTNAPHLEIWF